jgi:uncharacterized membrane protein
MRLALWIVSGIVLGLILHLVIILMLPLLSPRTVWSKLPQVERLDTMYVLSPLAPGTPNPLGLDPTLDYGICRLDLSKGPGEIVGDLPDAFWSVAIFDSAGLVIYSTTSRATSGQTLELGVFNDAETRLLALQKFPVDEGLLIVRSPTDDIHVVVRLAAPYEAMRPRYRQALEALTCGNIKT